MNNAKLQELMHGEMDGVNSRRESAKLKAYLDAHPEAAKHYQELTAMSALLQQVKPVEPPSHLHRIIMNALPADSSPKKALSDRFSQVWLWLAPRAEFKYAMVFVGGVMAGSVLLALFALPSERLTAIEWSKLYGTIGAPSAENRATEADLHEIKRPEVAGSITLKQAETMFFMEFALDSPHDIEVVVTFAEDNLGFRGFLQDESAPAEISVSAGAIKLTHAGPKSYALVFERAEASAPVINFQVLSSQKVVYAHAFSPK